jgi:hypothetical protein
MDDALFVSEMDSPCSLCDELRRSVGVAHLIVPEPRRERSTLAELHRDERPALGIHTCVKDLDDVRMIEPPVVRTLVFELLRKPRVVDALLKHFEST